MADVDPGPDRSDPLAALRGPAAPSWPERVRGVVEREFYKMDQEVSIQEPPLTVRAAPEAVHSGEVPELPTPAPVAAEAVATPPAADAPVAAAPVDPSKPSA